MSTRGSATTRVTLATITAIALILSTGAAFVDGSTDPLTDDIAFQSGDNPYTYPDEDPTIATPDEGSVRLGVDTRVTDLMPDDRVIERISAHARPADPETVTQGGDGNDGNRSDDDERAAEPTALDLADFAGLVALVAMVLATLFLFRRAPW